MTKGSLRYRSTENMPQSLRKAVEAQETRAVKELRHVEQNSGVNAPGWVPGKTCEKRPKYGNKTTIIDGIRFDSKREATYYEQLKYRQQTGEVSYWLRQVPVHLPGGTRLIVDFLVFFSDHRAPEYVDVKGRETPAFKIKRREIQHHYPIKVVLA